MIISVLKMISELIIPFILGLLLLFGLRKNHRPFLGIYNRPGRWFPFKYLVFRILLWFRQVSRREQKRGDMIKLERPQALSDHPLAFDAVFFIGADNNGRYFILGTERRQNGIINGLCYILMLFQCIFSFCHLNLLKTTLLLYIIGRIGEKVAMIPDAGGLLCSQKLPDTVLFGADPQQYGTEGISAKMLEPLQRWTLQYQGPMKYNSKSNDMDETVDVNINLTWTASSQPFSYDTDTPHHVLARTIATEPWTRKYFDNLKKAHQCHYEQMGNITGLVIINTIEYPLKMDGFRDHSFGHKRDWTLMHRYAFHLFFLENGIRGSVIVVCQPSTCTSLQRGFINLPNGKILPIEWCDFVLYQHGENGMPPRDYAFCLSAGRKLFEVQVEVVKESIHYVGFDWDAKMVERFIKYRVNGCNGRGVSEFHYRNKTGRIGNPSDPTWFSKMPKS